MENERSNVSHPGFAVGRVYPRLFYGGAERGIMQLLRKIPDTHLLVCEDDGGPIATEAKRTARKYTRLHHRHGRFASLVRALRACDVVHLHTINNHPLIPLAAQIAGPQVLVQTIHNHLDADACHFVDYSILIGEPTRQVIETPTLARTIPNGVECPDYLPPFEPWFRRGDEVRFVEVRRADKKMAFTIEGLAETGLLDGFEWRAEVVGVSGPSADPRITNVGVQGDVAPWIARADFLLSGSSAETFGRTVFEALANGTIPVVTPLDVIVQTLASEDVCSFFSSFDPRQAALELRSMVAELGHGGGRYEAVRQSGHLLVRAKYSVESMIQQTIDVYRHAATHRRPRNFTAADLPDESLDAFGSVIDQLMDPEAKTMPFDSANQLPPIPKAIVAWAAAHYGILVSPADRIRQLEASIQVLGNRHVLYQDLGTELTHLGQFSAAIKCLEHAIHIDGAKVSSYRNLITCHQALGNTAQAQEMENRLQRAIL